MEFKKQIVTTEKIVLTLNNYTDVLIFLLAKTNNICNSPHMTWDEKYHIVFSTINNLVQSAIKEFQLPPLDYYDPDSGYEDDCLAFKNGLKYYLRHNFNINLD